MTADPSADPAFVVGAYSMAPAERGELHRLLDLLTDLPGVDGFEMPLGWFAEAGAEPFSRKLPDGGRHVLTLVGASVREASLDPGFGLASTDADGRRRALDLVREGHREVAELSEKGTGVVAVELHAYPSVEPSRARDAAEVLTESLAEIAAWSWDGVALTLEHCDARTDEHPWVKGLLPLDAEIAAVQAVRETAPATRIGCGVNWGRSAIESRDPRLPVEHVRRLQERGLLDGVVFSGATAHDGIYGPAWGDVHLPMREHQPESLMDQPAVTATMAAGTPSLFVGAKIAVRPPETPVERRVDIVRAVLEAVQLTG